MLLRPSLFLFSVDCVSFWFWGWVGRSNEKMFSHLRRIIHLQNPSKLTENRWTKSGGLSIKLRPLHFLIKTYYLSAWSELSNGKPVSDNPSLVWIRPILTTSLRIGGLINQHHCCGTWKQQGMVTKSQTGSTTSFLFTVFIYIFRKCQIFGSVGRR